MSSLESPDTSQSRYPARAGRSLSVLLVVALALQVGLGLSEGAALLRQSANQPDAVRALAEAVVRYASRPVRLEVERPARASTRDLAKQAVRAVWTTALPTDGGPELLRDGLIALPPPAV